MSNFRFLHAADIHLDSPLHGLSRYDGLPEEDVRGATRAAFDNLVQQAIAEEVDFVVIAGDLFDGDWKDMSTGLYFARAMGRLDRVGIPVFLLAGNHDAASVITRSIPWPPNVRLFGARRPETHVLGDLQVAVHGQSFSTPAVTDNLVLSYPQATEHHFNIGMLHTALAGRKGHADYAPCGLDDLRAKHYDYWALGHVHQYEVVCETPHVVFPGNIQGRTIRETGPKGAVIVTVEDGQVSAIDRVCLDVIRWIAVDVDCTDVCADGVAERLRGALLATWQDNADGLPLIARLLLTGGTASAGALIDSAGELRDAARAVASSISPNLFIEKLRLLVTKPAAAELHIGDDLAALIDQATTDPGLQAILADDLAPFLLSAQALLPDAEETELRRYASEGKWDAVVGTAAQALRARLTREA